jgi:hypothetical protein
MLSTLCLIHSNIHKISAKLILTRLLVDVEKKFLKGLIVVIFENIKY